VERLSRHCDHCGMDCDGVHDEKYSQTVVSYVKKHHFRGWLWVVGVAQLRESEGISLCRGCATVLVVEESGVRRERALLLQHITELNENKKIFSSPFERILRTPLVEFVARAPLGVVSWGEWVKWRIEVSGGKHYLDVCVVS